MIKRGEGKNAVLLLHGRGGTGEQIMQLANNFDAACYAISAPGNAWYPRPFNIPKENNEPELSQSLKSVDEAVKELRKNHEKVYLVGFSQGACLACEYASENEVDGVVAFSGGLIGDEDELSCEAQNSTNIIIGCSEKDPFIPLKRAKKTAQLFSQSGARVFTLFYPGESHHITPKEMEMAKMLINN